MKQINYISEIVEKLKIIEPDKIILFGSAAESELKNDSDLDLLVVTRDNYRPKKYEERMAVYLGVSRLLREVKKRAPIDLLVYTRPSYKDFLKTGGIFSKEISKKGKILYEKNGSLDKSMGNNVNFLEI